MSTIIQKNAPLPIVSEEVAEQITLAFGSLFALMSTYGTPMGVSFSQAGRAEYEKVAVRALEALKVRQAHLREQAVAQFRQGVRDAIMPHIDRARADKEEYDALSPTLKARIGAFQTYILVPLSDMSEVFPPETTVQAQVKLLTDMGYKVSKSTTGTFSIRHELPSSITGVTPAAK